MNIRYYNIPRHWTKRIEPHIAEAKPILVRDFNRYTWGRWRKRFEPHNVPAEFESCSWSLDHRGRWPRYWDYVKHGACHWLVNFNLRLAELAEPSRPWRIITSDDHSTVFDGKATLFDLNFLAFKIAPEECLSLAIHGEELPPGKQIRCHLVEHYKRSACG